MCTVLDPYAVKNAVNVQGVSGSGV
jgi:hypothetical protein